MSVQNNGVFTSVRVVLDGLRNTTRRRPALPTPHLPRPADDPGQRPPTDADDPKRPSDTERRREELRDRDADGVPIGRLADAVGVVLFAVFGTILAGVALWAWLTAEPTPRRTSAPASPPASPAPR